MSCKVHLRAEHNLKLRFNTEQLEKARVAVIKRVERKIEGI
jgi:hypothetical protein